MKNKVVIIIGSQAENESFARMAAAAYIARFNPTLEEVAEVKTAVSEAVTNSIIHGYYEGYGDIRIECSCEDNTLFIEVTDYGVGIDDIELARKPMYTSKPELDRSGLGFAFMETFMDEISVESTPGKGTTVKMKKKIAKDMSIDIKNEAAVGFD